MAEIEARVEQEKVLLEWVAPARPFRKRQIQVMSVPLVIVVLVGIILLVSMEWILIVVLAALVFAYYAWSMVPPENVEYKITTFGIRIGQQFYGWQDMIRWWMEELLGQKVLVIESQGALLGKLILPLGDMSQLRVESIMEKMLIKDLPDASMVDRAGKWIAQKFPVEENVKL